MKFENVNKRFTEKVAEWMAKGYYINSATMSGHQGEISKIDLTDGKEVIRILLSKESNYEKPEPMKFYFFEYMTLVVGRATEENMFRPNSSDTMQTIWNNKLEVLEEERFYIINRNYAGEYWLGTKEEAIAAQAKRCERAEHENAETVVDLPKAKEVLLKVIRKRPGMKSVRPSEIEKVTRKHTDAGIEYRVKVRGKVVRFGCAG